MLGRVVGVFVGFQVGAFGQVAMPSWHVPSARHSLGSPIQSATSPNAAASIVRR
jgi:hypothetical protein